MEFCSDDNKSDNSHFLLSLEEYFEIFTNLNRWKIILNVIFVILTLRSQNSELNTQISN